MVHLILNNTDGVVHLEMHTMCCLIWPFAHTKLPKIQQVIEHYTTIALKDNVISLDEYREVQKC